MKKDLLLSVKTSSKIIEDVRWLSIFFESEAITHFALGLSLINEKLIDTLILRTPDNKLRLSLEVGEFQSSLQRTEIIKNEENCVALLLSIDELGYWLHFFLKYYRDGLAEVDHIDLEVEGTDTNRGLFLTLKVDKVSSPVSEEETRRRLGL